MNFEILPKLTKKYILAYVTEEEIFERYMNFTPVFNKLIRNPLRKDNNPTCSFYYVEFRGEIKLRFRDFAGYFWGDCFDLVGFLLRVDVSDKVGFNLVLHHIARSFKIHKYSEEFSTDESIKRQLATHKIPEPKEKLDFAFKIRNWEAVDARFWSKVHYNTTFLSEMYIYGVQIAWINKKRIYDYKESDPCYAYVFGKDQDGVLDCQFYFPFRTKHRFMINTSGLLGRNIIRPATLGIITKSYKDVGCIKLIHKAIGLDIDAVAISGESHILSKDDHSFLQGKYKFIISLLDFDRTGILGAIRLKKDFNIPATFFTNGTRKSKIDYGGKDLSEMIDKHGFDLMCKYFSKLYPIVVEQLEINKFPTASKFKRIWEEL